MFTFDRNFPGHKIITAILDAGGQVVARARSDLALPLIPGGWLPDGSRLSWLNAPSGKTSDRLPVRVAEHNAVLPCGDGQDVSETCTLITTLLDHETVSADQVRGAYQSRWPASETTFGEDKTTIAGAGDRTSGPVLRSGTPRLVIQEFWAWMTATQLVRASAAASLATDAAAARALRRRPGSGPVTTDQVSFTAARQHAVCSMVQSRVTAGTSLAALAALAEDTHAPGCAGHAEAIPPLLNQMMEADSSGSRLERRTIDALGLFKDSGKRSRRHAELYHAECVPRSSLRAAPMQVKRLPSPVLKPPPFSGRTGRDGRLATTETCSPASRSLPPNNLTSAAPPGCACDRSCRTWTTRPDWCPSCSPTRTTPRAGHGTPESLTTRETSPTSTGSTLPTCSRPDGTPASQATTKTPSPTRRQLRPRRSPGSPDSPRQARQIPLARIRQALDALPPPGSAWSPVARPAHVLPVLGWTASDQYPDPPRSPRSWPHGKTAAAPLHLASEMLLCDDGRCSGMSNRMPGRSCKMPPLLAAAAQPDPAGQLADNSSK